MSPMAASTLAATIELTPPIVIRRLHVRIVQRALREILVDDGQLGCQALELIVVAQRHSLLVWRQRQLPRVERDPSC